MSVPSVPKHKSAAMAAAEPPDDLRNAIQSPRVMHRPYNVSDSDVTVGELMHVQLAQQDLRRRFSVFEPLPRLHRERGP